MASIERVVDPVSRYGKICWLKPELYSKERITKLARALAEEECAAGILSVVRTELPGRVASFWGLEPSEVEALPAPGNQTAQLSETADGTFIVRFAETVLQATSQAAIERTCGRRMLHRPVLTVCNLPSRVSGRPRHSKLWSRLVLQTSPEGETPDAPESGIKINEWATFIMCARATNRELVAKVLEPHYADLVRQHIAPEASFLKNPGYEILIDATNTFDELVGQLLRDMNVGRIDSAREIFSGSGDHASVAEKIASVMETLGYDRGATATSTADKKGPLGFVLEKIGNVMTTLGYDLGAIATSTIGEQRPIDFVLRDSKKATVKQAGWYAVAHAEYDGLYYQSIYPDRVELVGLDYADQLPRPITSVEQQDDTSDGASSPALVSSAALAQHIGISY